MKVIHITPTYFDDTSIIGGGERYPTELAFWMSKVTDTTLVSFSSERKSYRRDSLKVEIYPVRYFAYGNKLNPLSIRYLYSILKADIVHIHNINTLVSDVGCLVASLLGKRVFTTDYGGGGGLVLNTRFPVFRGYHNAIAYSQFGLDMLPPGLQEKAILVKGGIDIEKFRPDSSIPKENKILYVGRIVPHKGVDYLIEAFRLLNRPDYKLIILGRVYSENYYQYLKNQAENLNIEFVHDADDTRLLHEYRSAMVTVLPSVHRTCYGDYTSVPELMGFTLMESQACGTPVICTDAGAMHEFVATNITDFIVKQNSSKELAKAIEKILYLLPTDYIKYQEHGSEWIKLLGWAKVVEQYLSIYSSK